MFPLLHMDTFFARLSCILPAKNKSLVVQMRFGPVVCEFRSYLFIFEAFQLSRTYVFRLWFHCRQYIIDASRSLPCFQANQTAPVNSTYTYSALQLHWNHITLLNSITLPSLASVWPYPSSHHDDRAASGNVDTSIHGLPPSVCRSRYFLSHL